VILSWLSIAAGLIGLLIGGDLLVRGAVNIASRAGLSPLVIGLTLVGFGTSTPELVTSVQASLVGAPGIAYGNIVGSNIANILLIVGVSALIFPVTVASASLRRDGATMLAASLVFAGLVIALPMQLWIGIGFLAVLMTYVYIAFRQERREPAVAATDEHGAVYAKAAALEAADPATLPGTPAGTSTTVSILMTLAGLILLLAGGALLVNGAVSVASALGIAQSVIGVTIVAVGTSLPELVTSLMAALRKQGDLVFGNIVGSNIYNILGIGGVTAIIAPGPVPQQIAGFDISVMIGATLLLAVFAWSGLRIARWEGAVLLAGYAVYLALLWIG
jgi:cation:H+ antiporter